MSGTGGRNGKAERAGNVEASVGQVGVIVGCEYMLGLTKQFFLEIYQTIQKKNKSLCIRYFLMIQ